MKRAILTSGLPGAGKSTIIKRCYSSFLETAVLVDPDKFKAEHPDYDPKNPSALHEWSSMEAKKLMMSTMVEGKNLIIDGTGTNSEKMVKQIKDLQGMGYEVELLYVQVSLKTSLKRNAERERSVPESLVREKAELISVAFEITSRYADKVTVIDNN